jgi:hypothetical protein
MSTYFREKLVLGADLAVDSSKSTTLDHSRTVTALSVSNDGQLLAIGDKSGRIVVSVPSILIAD